MRTFYFCADNETDMNRYVVSAVEFTIHVIVKLALTVVSHSSIKLVLDCAHEFLYTTVETHSLITHFTSYYEINFQSLGVLFLYHFIPFSLNLIISFR